MKMSLCENAILPENPASTCATIFMCHNFSGPHLCLRLCIQIIYWKNLYIRFHRQEVHAKKTIDKDCLIYSLLCLLVSLVPEIGHQPVQKRSEAQTYMLAVTSSSCLWCFKGFKGKKYPPSYSKCYNSSKMKIQARTLEDGAISTVLTNSHCNFLSCLSS